MNPTEILRPLIKQFDIPDSLVRLLYLLLEPVKEEEALGYTAALVYLFNRLPKVREPTPGMLTATVSQLAGSSALLWPELLSFKLSFDLPYRNEHTHILGAPGSGKTELIKKLAYHDIQTGASVIVMAPKGNLVETLAKASDGIWVRDWSQVGLNLLDLDVNLLIWVLESLLESAPTSKQKAFLHAAAKDCKNLTELRTRLKRKPEPVYKETAEQLEWRLDLLLSDKNIESIFSRETNLDIQSVMDGGKVLLLDTKYLGDLGSSFIGRFIVALISRATRNRTTRHPCYIYLDECPFYITEHIETLLDTAREANVGLTLAHQNLAQLSPRLAQSVHNTALKFVGRVNHDDAGHMAKQMGLRSEHLQNLPRLQFYLSGLGSPFIIPVTPGEIDRLAVRHREHFTSSRLTPKKKEVGTEDSYDPKEW